MPKGDLSCPNGEDNLMGSIPPQGSSWPETRMRALVVAAPSGYLTSLVPLPERAVISEAAGGPTSSSSSSRLEGRARL
jgi:hypothetical protein